MIETEAPPEILSNGLLKTLSTARALGIDVEDPKMLQGLDHERLARVPFRDFAREVLTHLGRDLDSD